MQIAKQFIFGLLCLPLVIILALAASLVAVALGGIYLLMAIFHPVGPEWSA